MNNSVMAMLLVTVFAASLSACSEKPQRVVSEGEQYNAENGISPLRERTLNQGESHRMSY